MQMNPDSGLMVAGLAAAGLAAWGASSLTYQIYKYIRATPLQRRRLRHSYRVRATWKRTAMNTSLVRVDEASKGKTDPFNGKPQKPRTMVPKIKVFPEPWGLRIMLKTIAKVGLDEVEKASGWLADAWDCESVEVIRKSPGVLEIRAVVGQPLDEHFPYDFGGDDLVLPVGRNSWGKLIGLTLRELSGVKVAGLPGFGKTTLLTAWIAKLAQRADVQFCVFDGKTADPRYGDWSHMGERAIFVVGDNPEAANQKLTEIVRLIKDRPGHLVDERGTHKFWKHGPTPLNPLVLVVMDECHNFSDTKGLTGQYKAVVESNQRMMQTVSKEGRGTGVIGIFLTQKQTGDAIPTAVRDNLGVGICFATFTIEAAEAALGAAIRKDEPNDPTLLNDQERFNGVAVVTGLPGLGARYDRVRIGDVDEDQVLKLIQASGHLRRDVIPAAAPVLRDTATADEKAGGSVPLQKPATRSRKKAS